MRFTKMQGAGNDYVYIDCFRETIPSDPAALSIQVSDRHFGIGSDGLILICPSDHADARMRMFNVDGSESEMCGNGIRCVAKYVYDHGIAKKSRLAIETGRGILQIDLNIVGGTVATACVDMGEPILRAEQIPTLLQGNPPILAPLEVLGQTLHTTCVSMGNPHCVIFVEQIEDYHVHNLGPVIETHPAFPRRINVEFVSLKSPKEVNMRVWERGSGETLACGTGACGVCVAGVLSGRTDRQLLVHLRGGDLELHWSKTDNHVYMTGPAVEVFTGDWPG